MHWLPLIVVLGLGARLSLIDMRVHRLPNRDVAVMTVAVLAAILVQRDAALAQSAALCALRTLAVYTVVYLVSRGQFGMGDVKYAVPLGLVLGCYSPDAWLVAVMLSFALSAAVSVALLALGRLSLRDRLAFGPYMTIATVAAALLL